MTLFILTIFILVYLGMAAGRVPGLRLDRTGIAIIGAILLFAGGAISGPQVHERMDYATLALLFSLMVISAQFSQSGFYDRLAWKLGESRTSPGLLLGAIVLLSGALSAVLSNDIVVFALTPMLCLALRNRGGDPRPYLIALAGGANAGSTATLIGNPQNILIGQSGQLEFTAFMMACGIPACLALLAVITTLKLQWRQALTLPLTTTATARPPVDRMGLARGLAAIISLLILFITPLPHVTGGLLVAGALLISRRYSTRDVLGGVDWPLLLLFAGLFVVTGAVAESGMLEAAKQELLTLGIQLSDWPVIAGLSLLVSNTIGNVPGVILILATEPNLPPPALYSLAIFSTLAGNLLITGSLANIIMAEQAEKQGVRLGFWAHAKSGIPMTFLSFVFVIPWVMYVLY